MNCHCRTQMEGSRSEVEELRRSLQAKGSELDKMNSDTSLYKQQYEQLLVEYNAYLEDLETLQKKSESLEKLKALYESQISTMKTELQSVTAERELADKKREEAVERRVAVERECSALEDKCREAESALFKERTRNRELADELEDNALALENLKDEQHQQQQVSWFY